MGQEGIGAIFFVGVSWGAGGAGVAILLFWGKGGAIFHFFGLVITHHITLDHCRSHLDLLISNLDLCRSNLMMNIRPMYI